MTNRNRFHITDTETYNNTGEVLIDHPAMIASMARTHIIDIELTNIPEYRGDLYENRIAARIRNAAKRIGVDVTIDIHRNSSIVVRPLTEWQGARNAGIAHQAAKTRATNKRLRG